MKIIRGLVYLLAIVGSASLKADPAAGAGWSLGGHVKYQASLDRFPENSTFHDLLGSANTAQSLTARLNSAFVRGRWEFKADYQIIAQSSDTIGIDDSPYPLPGAPGAVISDDRRWWDLSQTLAEGTGSAIVNRLDRLYVGYSSAHMVWRFGRQAISWGNGLIFTPMDVFNPFDPAAVDREYKTGDDMLYGQWLFENGNDLQGVLIVRRNPLTGRVASDQSSFALKYHSFLAGNELDVIAAEHYDDRLLGIGGVFSLGGALLRGDVTWTDTGSNSTVSAVCGINYSWVWGGRNVSGLVEYYYAGFGQAKQDYALDRLRENTDLFKRLERGELFTLGRDYLAASLTVELTPLLRLTPNVFMNLLDPSALAQLVAQYDWKQDSLLLAAVNIPVGPDGSEYGGIDSQISGKYLSSGLSLYLQLAVYF